jgi:hypothetical protein
MKRSDSARILVATLMNRADDIRLARFGDVVGRPIERLVEARAMGGELMRARSTARDREESRGIFALRLSFMS